LKEGQFTNCLELHKEFLESGEKKPLKDGCK
jgi:hypothetical protein